MLYRRRFLYNIRWQGTFVVGQPVFTSGIERLPMGRKKYRSYLPLMPYAIEQFDLDAFDVVLSSSHAVASERFINE